MMLILGLIALVLVSVWLFTWYNKITIDWRSIISPTLPLDTGVFGVYCFTGKQGSGKTYSLNKFVRKHVEGRTVYSNVTLKNFDYVPLKSIDHLLSLVDEKNCFIVYDEIFTLLSDKTIPKTIRERLMEFLTQQRKQGNIFFTTAQEWLELPMTFRRFVRVQIECETRPLGKLGGILIEDYYDATKMKWSQLDNEYIAPRIHKKYSKYERRFMETYDTFERIRRLSDVGLPPVGGGRRQATDQKKPPTNKKQIPLRYSI